MRGGEYGKSKMEIENSPGDFFCDYALGAKLSTYIAGRPLPSHRVAALVGSNGQFWRLVPLISLSSSILLALSLRLASSWSLTMKPPSVVSLPCMSSSSSPSECLSPSCPRNTHFPFERPALLWRSCARTLTAPDATATAIDDAP